MLRNLHKMSRTWDIIREKWGFIKKKEYWTKSQLSRLISQVLVIVCSFLSINIKEPSLEY